jgi:hypothetical protein
MTHYGKATSFFKMSDGALTMEEQHVLDAENQRRLLEAENKRRLKEKKESEEMEKRFELFHPILDNERDLDYRCRLWAIISNNRMSLVDEFQMLTSLLQQDDTDHALSMVISRPMLLTMKDHNGWYPFHYVMMVKDLNYKVVFSFMREWLLSLRKQTI